MAQPCKDAGIATDAAGILGQGSVKDVMEPVFDGPVAADGLGQLFGAGPAGAQVQGRLLGAGDEGLAGGVEDLGGARDLDQALEVIVPGLQAAAGGQGPHAHAALLDAVAPAQRGAVVIYTTNAIESLNSKLRKIIKTRVHIPSDEAAAKLIWLALRNITAEHGRSVREWCEVMKQLAIAYGERFSPLAS